MILHSARLPVMEGNDTLLKEGLFGLTGNQEHRAKM